MSDALAQFSPLTRAWFRETFGEPTPPQAQGWLPIQRGEHTLILAPTGSGKTLAAFLWGIDQLLKTDERPTTNDEKRPRKTKSRSSAVLRPSTADGIRLLYISPLKALNNDIERNLRMPLEGIREFAARAKSLGLIQDDSERIPLPHLRVAVRTGDTPTGVRAEMLKHPPHILITTPESLYLMLTSPRARELFRTTRTVIVDEIHTLAGSKRGVHLALSLERLQHIAQQPVQRIGLSATIKPLDEVARFLGGQEAGDKGQGIGDSRAAPSDLRPLISRPVTIVDARYKKPLDLEIVTVVDDFRQLGTDSIWPYVVPNVLNDIRSHNTTLVFANNRRLAERTADRLNAQLDAEQSEEIPPGTPLAIAPGGKMRDRGIFAIGAAGPIRAHHGSMSKEARREMEEELKAGKLAALVGTSSLELGIDIGTVDLVVQLQSPKSVAQGLQRVGRSGHLVGQTSHGKIYATFREDLAEAAAIAKGMLEGDVEATHTPQNALDVLAQQIVACVAMEDWDADELFRLVRGAYPYHALSYEAYVSVLEMLTGKYFLEAPGARAVSALRPKIAWDRVHNRLTALPGSRLLAISNVGTIPDTGQFKVVLADNKTRIGELDEEFVLETRVGDTFLLGSQVWRATEITDDRVVVADAAGAVPRMPFWRGDAPWRPYELGVRIGKFRREVAERVGGAIQRINDSESPIQDWLEREYALDEKSARNLVEYVESQIKSIGAISSDQTIIVETFQNAVGDPFMVVHSPFGGRVNGAWAVALTGALRERMGVTPEVMTNDDGIIFRFSATAGDAPVDVVARLTAGEARERILRELPDAAVFGAQFRMNAARALLLTRPRAGQRTPFWLQRLKAKDLLAYAKRFPEFPILIETYRDVLSDVFDLPHLDQVLQRIASGGIRVVVHESLLPSPIASSLLFNFVSTFLYEWDAPKAERNLQLLSVPRAALQKVMQGVEWSELLKPEAVADVVARVQHLASGYQARSAEELAIHLQELGDLTTDELVARSAGDDALARAWVDELARAERIVEIEIPTARGRARRWIAAEARAEYAEIWSSETILQRFLRTAGPVTRAEILTRYAFEETWLDAQLAGQIQTGELARGHFTARERDEVLDAQLLEQIHRRTLTLLRGKVQPVSLHAYADFLARWQHAHPATRLSGEGALETVLRQLRGAPLQAGVWQSEILAARLAGSLPTEVERAFADGGWVWVCDGTDSRRMCVRVFKRGEGALFLNSPDSLTDSEPELSKNARAVADYLREEGASFAADIQVTTRQSSEALANALIELTLRGLATNDSLETLLDFIAHGAVARAAGASAPGRKPLSALEVELDARLGPRPPKPTQYRQAKQRTLARIQRAIAQQAPSWRGRWALVHRASILGAPLTEQARAEGWARLLLERYGVVTREVLAREEVPNLDAVYAEWQRMEWRGQARRGVFVAGVSGIQYALPEAVERLRTAGEGDDAAHVPYVLNATDPANVFGGEAGALKFARVAFTHLVLIQGQPVLIVQDGGARITPAPGAADPFVRDALREFFARPATPRHNVVLEWNGEPVLGSPGEPLLKELGFYRMPRGMERWKHER